MSTIDHIEGKYEILEKIKEGGMGAIYKVRHRLLDEIRVIKILRPQLEGDEDIRLRFTQEARVAIRLRHPNIAQLYDFSVDDDGNAYIVMEFIDGITIEEMVARIGPPPIGVAVEIMRQSLASLGHLHRKGIIHRDIAPDNLMLTREDDSPLRVKLIDMGIAKVLKGSSAQTMAGTFLGKVRYSSPEQLRGEGDAIDARCDIYSLGVVFYELLTSHGPFKATTVPTLVAAHLFSPPLSFAETDPAHRIPEDLQAIVLQALSKEKADRFPTAEAMADALAAVAARFPCEPEAIARAYVMPNGPTDRIPVQKVGSTQNRINRQFAVNPTATGRDDATTAIPRADDEPAPPPPDATGTGGSTPAATPPLPPAAKAESDSTLIRQIASFLSSADKLIDVGQIEEAKLQIGAVLQLDPGNPKAQRLLEKADAHTTAHPVGLSATEALAVAMAEVESLLARGDLATARALVERVEAELGRSRTLEEVRGRIVKREEQLASDRVLREAEEHLRGGLPGEALRVLEEFLATSGVRNRKLDSLLARAQSAQREQEESEARQRGLEDAMGAAQLAIDSNDFEGARGFVASARERCGELPDLDTLARRIDEAEQRKLESDILSLLSEARGLADQNRFAEAIDTLEHALALRPQDDGIRRALAATQRAQQRFQREEERQRAVAEAAARLHELVASGQLDEAAADLRVACETWGESDALSAVRTALDEARKKEVARRVRALLREAGRCVEQNAFPAAIERIEEAAGLAPDNAEIPEILAKTRQARAEYEETQHRQAVLQAAVREVRFLLQSGRLDAAEERLARAVVDCGETMELGALRQRLQSIRHQEREAHVKLLLREAVASVEAFHFREGVSRVEEALRLKPGDPTLIEILGKMQTAWRAHEATERRRKALAEAVTGLEDLLEADNLDRAARRMSAITTHLGGDARLDELQERLDAALATRRADEEKLGQLVTEARRLIALQSPEQALPLLEEATAMRAASAEVTVLLGEAQVLVGRQEEQRKRIQEMLEAMEAIEQRLEAGELDEAERALGLAEKMFAGEAVIRGLRRRLEQQRTQAKALQVIALVEDARALAMTEHYEKAILETQRAQGLDSGNQEVRDLLQELPRRQAATSVEALVARGALDEAARALALAEKLHGTSDPLLAPLRQRLEEEQRRTAPPPLPKPMS
ncbi:MAG TPA: protein kinase [Thermoanaerobaculaceae bacterium]|nr:protein kinase [Thermoanaerobaculaceae bacterium]